MNEYVLDRVATEEEIQNLPEDLPAVSGVSKYEDLFSVNVIMNKSRVSPNEEKFAANMERWTLRTN